VTVAGALPCACAHRADLRWVDDGSAASVTALAPEEADGSWLGRPVDVVADIEMGITSVCEGVQAKRHKTTIQRKDLDALRGSLYRFNAARGTTIATAPFSESEAVFATGVAPITRVDCHGLIDLLKNNSRIELLSVDADAFSGLRHEPQTIASRSNCLAGPRAPSARSWSGD
jgi:hypothetical protein